MGVYDGSRQAQDHLFDVAKNVLQAFLHAPQITGRTVLRSVILTGEDVLPVIEVFEELAKVLSFIKISAELYRKTYDAGHPPVLLLLVHLCNLAFSSIPLYNCMISENSG